MGMFFSHLLRGLNRLWESLEYYGIFYWLNTKLIKTYQNYVELKVFDCQTIDRILTYIDIYIYCLFFELLLHLARPLINFRVWIPCAEGNYKTMWLIRVVCCSDSHRHCPLRGVWNERQFATLCPAAHKVPLGNPEGGPARQGDLWCVPGEERLPSGACFYLPKVQRL